MEKLQTIWQNLQCIIGILKVPLPSPDFLDFINLRVYKANGCNHLPEETSQVIQKLMVELRLVCPKVSLPSFLY